MNSDKITGKNSVLEALSSDVKINKIWFDNPGNPKVREILTLAKQQKIPTYQVDGRKLTQIAGSDEHRSVVAEISPVAFIDEKEALKLDLKKILVAVNIEDPHNLGAIIRSAHAFNIDAVCFTARKSVQINQTIIQSSAGAALKTRLVRIGNVTTFIEKLKENGFWIYGSSIQQEKAASLNNIEFDDKSVILVGNEGKGLSDKVLSHCDFIVYIPVKFNSLNVSVATAIILNKLYNQ